MVIYSITAEKNATFQTFSETNLAQNCQKKKQQQKKKKNKKKKKKNKKKTKKKNAVRLSEIVNLMSH